MTRGGKKGRPRGRAGPNFNKDGARQQKKFGQEICLPGERVSKRGKKTTLAKKKVHQTLFKTKRKKATGWK